MINRLLAVIAASFIATGTAGAATINYFEGGAQTNSPGLTGFATTGADMDGLAVTACFTVLGCQSVAWADRAAPGSGGVSGAGWDLSLTGDSFNANWLFEMSDNLGQLVSLLLDGRTSFVIFDRTFGNATGTDGSALGRDWFTSLNGGTTIDVTYLDPTGVGGAAPVGDLFQQVFVDFGTTGPRVDFSFVQDTDNDIRFRGKVPEPTTLLLLSIGLLGLTAYGRARPR